MNKALIFSIAMISSLSLSACMIDTTPNHKHTTYTYKYDHHDRYRTQHRPSHPPPKIDKNRPHYQSKKNKPYQQSKKNDRRLGKNDQPRNMQKKPRVQ